MCEPASLMMLGVALAGAGMQAKGQHDAGKKAKRTMARAMEAQEGLRKKALGQSEEVVNQQGAQALEKEAEAPQQVVGSEGAAGDVIAKAFTESTGTSAGNSGRITGAASGVKRTAKNEATRAGFSRALQANLARLGNLSSNNLLLGEDSRRISAALPYDLQRAGEAGSNWRLAGLLAQTAGQGAISNQAWSAGAGGSSAGLNGVDYGPDYRRPSGQPEVA